MAAYVMVDVVVNDPEPYQEYLRGVPATVAQYGGRFLVRGGKVETIEGSWNPQRVVVIEFPSADQARAWYHSPEYQAILPIRLRNATSNFLAIVEGVG